MTSIKKIFSRSGSSDKSNNPDHSGHEHSKTTGVSGKYYCPMRCEGDKTYDQPGNCPVCNMHLVPVDDKKQST